jgi:hypothetical protein
MAILAFLTLVQCSFKKPEAPTWDTKLTIPLVNKTYDMTELIDKIDQDNLSTDSLGNPFFYFQEVLDTVTVSGSFSVADVSETVAESIGVVQLDPFAGANVNINLSDYVIPIMGDIPPISFDLIEPLPAMGEFAVATIETGFAVVTVENQFGLDLDTVIVTINDLQLGGQVSSYSVPGGIPAGNIQVDTIDLAGKTISNELEMAMHCHTPGATSFSLSGKYISATVTMPEGPTVSSATARIPEISKQFSESTDITSSHQLEVATLESGQLVLDIDNNTNVSANLTITIPDIKTGGSSLTINQPVTPQSTQQFIYDLSGYNLEPSDQVLPQTLAIDLEADIPSSGQQLVTISAGDQISVTTAMQNVSLASVQGILAPTTADFVDIQQNVEIPKGFDQVQLTAAVLVLEIENTVNIPGSFSIIIDGDQGQQKTINGNVSPGLPQAPVTTVVIDSNLSAFMDPIPSVMTVNGSATFGDGVTSGSVNANDYIAATIILNSPLEMVVGETTIDGDYQSIEVDQDAATKITENLNLARIYTTVANHLPLGVRTEIYFSGDSATLYSAPEVVLGPITVTNGALNPDGTVDTSVVSGNILTFDSEQAQVLLNDPMWIGQVFTLESTNGETVRFTGQDFVSVSGYIEVDLTINENLWED